MQRPERPTREETEAAIKRAQEIVRRYIHDSTGIVDEFIAERRAEAELE